MPRRAPGVPHPFAIATQLEVAAKAAAQAITAGIAQKRLTGETTITDRLLDRIEAETNARDAQGLLWQSRTFTDRGPRAEEPAWGADFVGVLSADTEALTFTLGFLGQAKRADADGLMSSAEYRRLQEQCERMLSHTPAAFVFVYAATKLAVLPAITVLGSPRVSFWSFGTRTIEGFFREHGEGFLGDRQLCAPDEDSLEQLLRESEARRALLLAAQTNSKRQPPTQREKPSGPAAPAVALKAREA